MVLALRLAVRSTRRHLPSTALLVVVMGLGTGIAAAVLAMAVTVWRPLSLEAPAPLVRIFGVTPESAEQNLSPPDFRDLRSRLAGVSAIAAITPFAPELTLTGHGEPRLTVSRRVSAGLFRALGVQLLRGREFTEADEQPPVRPVLISETFWQQVLGRTTDPVGRQLVLNGASHTIVGVVATHQQPLGRAEIWLPVQFPSPDLRGLRLLQVIGAMSPAATAAALEPELGAIAADFRQRFPATHGRASMRVVPLEEAVAGPVRPAMTLMAMSGVVLWILTLCVSLAFVVATSVTDRARLALVRALGAFGWREFWTRHAPALVLCAPALPAALLAAGWTLRLVETTELLALPRPASMTDAALIAASLLALTLVAMVAAVSAVAVAARPDLRVGGARASGASRLAVSIEACLAVVLVAVAATLVVALMQLGYRESGFESDGRFYGRLTLPPAPAPPLIERWMRVTQMMGSLPGVSRVALASELPQTGQNNPAPFTVTSPGADEVVSGVRAVTPSYFAIAGILPGAGRVLDDRDDARHPSVAVVNRRLARELFGREEDAIGRTVAVDVSAPPLLAEVVGVVSDVRHTSPWHEPMSEVFFSVWQVPLTSLTLVVEPAEVRRGQASTWERALRTAEPSMAVPVFDSWQHAARSQVRPYERRVLFSGMLAGTAVLLVMVSVWALTARSLAARRRELALRMALGCSASRTWAGLVAESGIVTLRGALVGGLLAWPVVKATVTSLGVAGPTGSGAVSSIVGVVAFVTVIGALAAASPARAAAALDPARELRS